MNKLNKSFMCYGSDTESVFGYPFQDRGFSGNQWLVMKKAVRKHPQFSTAFKILIPFKVPFFYDSVLNKFRIIADKNIDNNTMFEYINKYYTELKNVSIIDQFCKENKISTFDYPKTEEKVIRDIAIFLAENDIDCDIQYRDETLFDKNNI